MLGLHLQQSQSAARCQKGKGDYQWNVKIRPALAKCCKIVIRLAKRLKMYKIQVQEEHSKRAVMNEIALKSDYDVNKTTLISISIFYSPFT